MKHLFWIETASGERIEWRNLSERQALEMYRRTQAWVPDNVNAFGWEDDRYYAMTLNPQKGEASCQEQ